MDTINHFVEFARAFADTGQKARNDINITYSFAIYGKDEIHFFDVTHNGDLFYPYIVSEQGNADNAHAFSTAEEVVDFFKTVRKGKASLVDGTIQYAARGTNDKHQADGGKG